MESKKVCHHIKKKQQKSHKLIKKKEYTHEGWQYANKLEG